MHGALSRIHDIETYYVSIMGEICSPGSASVRASSSEIEGEDVSEKKTAPNVEEALKKRRLQRLT